MSDKIAFESTDYLDEGQFEYRRLGMAPPKASMKTLHFADFATTEIELPEETEFWRKRVAFPIRSFGNLKHGCCTRASQAVMSIKMERIEQRRTIDIADEEVIRVYYEMTAREYGGGDTGAYETDALSAWRNSEQTFKDLKGRPVLIDAYLRINHMRIYEIKKALHLSGAHGIKICFNLPLAWMKTYHWDVKEGQAMTGHWRPGGWGGHSLASVADYNKHGIFLDHTWDVPIGFVTWAGVMAYCNEAHLIVDSINHWKKKKLTDSNIDLVNMVSEINKVSRVLIPT